MKFEYVRDEGIMDLAFKPGAGGEGEGALRSRGVRTRSSNPDAV